MLIWWRCEGKEKLLLPEAQRLVRIQREIAHGFHRQVETNLILGLAIVGQRPRCLRKVVERSGFVSHQQTISCACHGDGESRLIVELKSRVIAASVASADAACPVSR